MTFDCQTCGACCNEGSRVYDSEYQVPSNMLVLEGNWWEKDVQATAIEDGQCIALQGQIGEQVRCTIYERRPALCRMFTAGSPECLKARKEYELPVSEG